ncbi:MAG: adenylate/guanylate cyclase domain-containing protein [Fimbriimonadaceae bacterium]
MSGEPGTYTFLFTDIENSSRNWESSPVQMKKAIDLHNEVLTSAVEANGGRIFKSLGDGIAAVFESAHQGVIAAVYAQQQLISSNWDGAIPIKARIGVHTGFAEPINGDYLGAAVNRVSRITNMAHGQQVLVSHTALNLATDILPKDFVFKNLGQVSLEGHGRTEEVFQVHVEGLPCEFPALLATSDKPNHNLVLVDRPFIGRHQERETLNKALKEGKQRLITIRGFGGMGKTTIARVCAWDNVEAFPEGVWWVDCETANSREEIVANAYQAIQKPIDPSDPERGLAEAIGNSKFLMVFDCFERVALHAGIFDGLLKKCPNLQVVVTSRVLLGLPWEYEFELRGLTNSQKRGATVDAMALFAEAAVHVRPDFAITRANRKILSELVTSLEFIPLAIVITAGRLRHLSLEEVLAQVKKSLLSAVKQAQLDPGRHGGLRQVIETSISLLDEQDRRVAGELSVFDGGFYLSDASAVLANEIDLFDTISRLRDHSLLSSDYRGDRTRFKALDSVREYLAEAVPPDTLKSVRLAHAKHYLTVAKQIRQFHDSRKWAEASDLIALEGGNLRRAISTAIESSDRVPLKQMAGLLARPFFENGLGAEFDRLVGSTIEVTDTVSEHDLVIELLGLQGMRAKRLGDTERAIELWDKRVQVCATAGNFSTQAETLIEIANTLLKTGNLNRAKSFLDLYLKLEGLIEDHEILVAGWMFQAVFSAEVNEPADSLRFCQKVLEGFDLEQATEAAFYFLRSLAEVYLRVSGFDLADKCLKKIVRFAAPAGFIHHVTEALVNLMELYAKTANLEALQEAVFAFDAIPKPSPVLYQRAQKARLGTPVFSSAKQDWQALALVVANHASPF